MTALAGRVRRSVMVAAVCSAIVGWVVGCSSGEDAPVSSSSVAVAADDGGGEAIGAVPATTLPSTVSAEQAALESAVYDAEQTIRRGAEAMFTWYPATDTSPADAVVRAARYLTVRMATPDGGGVRLPAGWAQWKTQQATVLATVEIRADEPDEPDSATRIKRVITITQRVDIGRGAPVAQSPVTSWVTAIRTSAGWRISDMRF